MDKSLVILQSYVNVESALKGTAGEQDQNLWVIYFSGHLALAQDRLVT